VWRADHAAEIAKAEPTFQYQSVDVNPMEERPAGSAAIDLLYQANLKFSVTIGSNQPPASAVTYNEEQNQCFFKKQGAFVWSTLPCTRRYFVKVDPKVLDTYVGQYEMPRYSEDKPAFIITLSREGDKLMKEAFGNKAEFRPLSETEFYLQEEDRTVKFIKNDQGQVTHIEWEHLTVKKIK
jgi:hypothetical protein